MIKGGAHHVHKGCSKHKNQVYLQSKCTQTRTYNKHNLNIKNTHPTHQCLTLTLFVHNSFHGIVIHVDRFTSVYCIQDVGKTACCSIGPLKPH